MADAQAKQAEKLRASVVRSRRRLAGFERGYGIQTHRFLEEMAAEDFEGGDQEYVEWAGEAKMLDGLQRELAELEASR